MYPVFSADALLAGSDALVWICTAVITVVSFLLRARG
jgi:hypothetical protein